MRIGIDARLIDETGVGRYIRNLIDELGKQDKEHQYVIFLSRHAFETLAVPNDRWQKRLSDVPWHSFSEQLVMPWIFAKEHLDLLHVPYFNIPIFYPGRFLVTIHDLTILHFDTGRATTLPRPLYKLRRLGYYLVLFTGLRRASKVLTVSQVTKQEIIDHFRIRPEKIVVTHEGVAKQKSNVSKPLIQTPYFLYVGNAYPHKNLEMLIKVFQRVTSKTKLVLVGKDDYFYRGLKGSVEQMKLHDDIVFFGEADGDELQNLYKNAVALVFPSLMEGFGLPGLEAMSVSTPVVCSDIPVFREIYANSALYFNPKNEKDVISKLQQIVSDKKLREDLMSKGREQVKRYSWSKMVRQTLRCY